MSTYTANINVNKALEALVCSPVSFAMSGDSTFSWAWSLYDGYTLAL